MGSSSWSLTCPPNLVMSKLVDVGAGYLVGDLVAPLLDGLNDLLNNGGHVVSLDGGKGVGGCGGGSGDHGGGSGVCSVGKGSGSGVGGGEGVGGGSGVGSNGGGGGQTSVGSAVGQTVGVGVHGVRLGGNG